MHTQAVPKSAKRSLMYGSAHNTEAITPPSPQADQQPADAHGRIERLIAQNASLMSRCAMSEAESKQAREEAKKNADLAGMMRAEIEQLRKQIAEQEEERETVKEVGSEGTQQRELDSVTRVADESAKEQQGMRRRIAEDERSVEEKQSRSAEEQDRHQHGTSTSPQLAAIAANNQLSTTATNRLLVDATDPTSTEATNQLSASNNSSDTQHQARVLNTAEEEAELAEWKWRVSMLQKVDPQARERVEKCRSQSRLTEQIAEVSERAREFIAMLHDFEREAIKRAEWNKKLRERREMMSRSEKQDCRKSRRSGVQEDRERRADENTERRRVQERRRRE